MTVTARSTVIWIAKLCSWREPNVLEEHIASIFRVEKCKPGINQQNIVGYLLNEKYGEPEKLPLLGNSCVTQQYQSHH
jgi:hypothetical protein